MYQEIHYVFFIISYFLQLELQHTIVIGTTTPPSVCLLRCVFHLVTWKLANPLQHETVFGVVWVKTRILPDHQKTTCRKHTADVLVVSMNFKQFKEKNTMYEYSNCLSVFSHLVSSVSASSSLSTRFKQRGTMELSDPASDKHMLKGSEGESVSEGSPPVRQDSTSNLENEEHIFHTSSDKADADTNCHGGTLVTPDTTLENVVESSPCVSEETVETLTSDEVKDSNATTLNINEQPIVLIANCSTELGDSCSNGSPTSSSVQSLSENSPTDSTNTSGISNGPSTPNSDTVSSSPASTPQTNAKTSAPAHSLSSPYDTDCSRKLISQIQRSLSQESLLDELESELLACQLPEGESEGERKGSPPVNGLPKDKEDCMVVFEKCVQYKYAQQEKAIHR